jgi:hypothetical protein
MWFHAKFVEDEQRRKADELVERRPERVHVMKDATRHGGGEWPRVVELFERDLPIRLTDWCARIDCEHVVAGLEQRRRDAALVAAADLEHARGRRRQL